MRFIGLVIFATLAYIVRRAIIRKRQEEKEKVTEKTVATPVAGAKPSATSTSVSPKPEPGKKGGSGWGKVLVMCLLMAVAWYIWPNWPNEVSRFFGLWREVNAPVKSPTAQVRSYEKFHEPIGDPDVKWFTIEVGPELSRVLTEIPENQHVRVGPLDNDPKKLIDVVVTGSNYNGNCKGREGSDCLIGKGEKVRDAQIRLKTKHGRFTALVRYSPSKKK